MDSIDERLRPALGELEAYLDGEPPASLPELVLPLASAWVLADAGFELEAAAEDARLYVDSYPFEGRIVGHLEERAATWLAQRLLLDGQGEARLERVRATLEERADLLADEFPRTAEGFRRLLDETTGGTPPTDTIWHALALRIVEAQVS